MKTLITSSILVALVTATYFAWAHYSPVQAEHNQGEVVQDAVLSDEEQLIEVSEHLMAPDLYLSLWLAPEEAYTDAFSRMVYGLELVNLVSSKCWTTDGIAANNPLFATLINANAIGDVGSEQAFERIALLQSYAQSDAAVLLHLGCQGVIKNHLLIANSHLDLLFQVRLEEIGIADAYRQVSRSLFGLIDNLSEKE